MMKKLNETDIQKLDFLQRGKAAHPVIVAKRTMEKGETFFFTMSEWAPMKTSPTNYLGKSQKNKRFSVRILADRSGFIVTRTA